MTIIMIIIIVVNAIYVCEITNVLNNMCGFCVQSTTRLQRVGVPRNAKATRTHGPNSLRH